MGNKIKDIKMKFAALAALASVTVANDSFFFPDEESLDTLALAEDVDMDELEDISLTEEEMLEAYGEEATMSNFNGVYPQCRMFRNMHKGHVYLSYNGALHWIPNPQTFNNLFKPVMWNKWYNKPHGVITATSIGQQLKPGSFLVKGNVRPHVYLLSY